jgi:hypothetical protein
MQNVILVSKVDKIKDVWYSRVYMGRFVLGLVKTKIRTILGILDWVEQNNHPL